MDSTHQSVPGFTNRFEPGMFTLPLVINSGNLKNVSVEYKLQVLEKYLETKRERPERYAIRNVLGLLAARMENYEQAEKYFSYILSESEDAKNLNALANKLAQKSFASPRKNSHTSKTEDTKIILYVWPYALEF